MSGQTLWGVHMGVHVGNRPLEGGYVAIGWRELGDLRLIPADREAFKTGLAQSRRDAKQGAIPVHAGILYRFVHEMQAGDIVVYPSKHDRMINIGRLTGEGAYIPDDGDEYPNRRGVRWLGSFPRTDFSQSALNEIGSAVTLFRVRRHADEFLGKIGVSSQAGLTIPAPDPVEEPADDDAATVAASRQAEETTGDFVIRRIMSALSGYDFEVVVAHLLECMGYTARVTQRSGDGGVDIIAHMDALGFQPPIVKVQCKRITGQVSRPEVDQLLGTLGEGEYGLFVCLGSFSRGAVELERNRAKLRLIDGEQFVELVP
jgi:restriction system protein